MNELMKETDKVIIDSKMNWYEVEQRMRELMFQIMKPITERTYDDRDRLSILETHVYKHHYHQIEQLTTYINKSDEFQRDFQKKARR